MTSIPPPEQPAALGADDKLAASPSKSGVKPLNPNALVWPAEARLSPVPHPSQTPPPAQQHQHPHFTTYQKVPNVVTPPGLSLRPQSPGQGSSGHPPLLPMPADELQQQQEFLICRNVVQMTPRPALVAVLLSLLEDMPHLAGTIRYRCERGAAVVAPAQHHSPAPVPPWSMAVDAAGSTPPSQQRRRPRHRDEEQQELCGIHCSMRALKHLQFNPATGLHECVHGFHCLVDNHASRECSAPPSNTVTPKKEPQRGGDAEREASVDVTRLQNLLDSVRLAHPDQR
jgi:hypothetical protein